MLFDSKMEAILITETSGSPRNAQFYNQEYRILHSDRREKLKSNMLYFNYIAYLLKRIYY